MKSIITIYLIVFCISLKGQIPDSIAIRMYETVIQKEIMAKDIRESVNNYTTLILKESYLHDVLQNNHTNSSVKFLSKRKLIHLKKMMGYCPIYLRICTISYTEQPVSDKVNNCYIDVIDGDISNNKLWFRFSNQRRYFFGKDSHSQKWFFVEKIIIN